jgi:hypothetical protein
VRGASGRGGKGPWGSGGDGEELEAPGQKSRYRNAKKGDFGELLSTHLENLIRSLLAQSRELSSRWSEMGAGELALAFGLLFDRTMRMLELQEGARGRGVRS